MTSPVLHSISQKLVGSGYSEKAVIEKSHQGKGVALSADGLTLAIGAPLNNNNTGCTWIYTRASQKDKWLQQCNRLVGTGYKGECSQGWSVSLSANGNTLAVGGNSDDNYNGATWIFQRIQGSWYQVGSKLRVERGKYESWIAHPQQGYAVALSGDGCTLAVGGPFRNAEGSESAIPFGGTELYLLKDGIWSHSETMYAIKIPGSRSFQGAGVALSYNGTTLAVRGLNILSSNDVFVYTLSEGVWRVQEHDLFSTTYHFTGSEGRSVSLSDSGDVLAVGGYSHKNEVGVTWIYRRTNNVWSIDQTIYAGDSSAFSPVVSEHTSILSRDGTMLAIAGTYQRSVTVFWTYRYKGSSWEPIGDMVIPSVKIEHMSHGVPMAFSGDGTTLAIGAHSTEEEIGSTWCYTLAEEVWIPSPKIIAPNYLGRPNQGESVAVSEDGTTLAVGGPQDGNDTGAVWIFIRVNNVWSQQGSKLVAPTYAGLAKQAMSIALSANGSILAVGAPADENSIGSTWIYRRSPDNSWSVPVRVRGNDVVAGRAAQGESVSLSSDGKILAVGGSYEDGARGCARVFNYEAVDSSWKQMGEKLVVPEAGYYQAHCISLSGDGLTLAIGYFADNDTVGAVRVFVCRDRKWSSEKKLVASDGVGKTYQGFSLSLDYTGKLLAVGGPGDNKLAGATWLYQRIATGWIQLGQKLVGSGAIGSSSQGRTVKLSSNGKRLVVGGCDDNGGDGAAWVFESGVGIRDDGSWLQLGEKRVGNYRNATSFQGVSVSTSADGKVMASGGSKDGGDVGAVWVFMEL